MSQNNLPQLTLEDLIPGGETYLNYQVSFPKQMQWWGDIAIEVKGDSVITIPIKENEKPQLIVDKKEINKILSSKDKLRDLKKINFLFSDKKFASIENLGKTHLIDIDAKSIIATYNLPKDASRKDFSKESLLLAYTKANNLLLLTPKGEEVAVTSDDDPNIVSGQSVHQNEFGISKGTFWSPYGNKLAFYRMDESMVTDYPLVNASERIAKLKDIKYPMAGMKSHHVTLGVYDVATQKTIFLKTGLPKEKYLTNIAWSPDEKYIYIAELNRGQDTCQLVRYDATTGKKDATLFVETHPKYVEPENPILFLKKSTDNFIWQSKRDGHNHLFLYNTNGELKKQLTIGDWDVTEVLGLDENDRNLYFISTETSPIDKHIYKLDTKTLKRTRLSEEEGVHVGLLSTSGKYIIDRYTSQHNAGKVDLIDTRTSQSTPFFSASNPYESVSFPEITLGSIKTNDGITDLYYRLTKPTDFDENKKYPVIIYVYGGPHSQLVDNSWLAQSRGWDIHMANKGYLVFTLDNRGTNNRGANFENITHRQLGVVETQDQMTGVEYLKSLPYVDQDRIGVHGWSYGGFMTLNLMLRHPEVFKVGVAGGPVTDWKYYEIMYGERYMDSPKENPKGYSETSMIEKAGNLKGRLMLIHGDEDPVVVMQHSLMFLKSAIDKGTHPDFFIYPGHGHNMIGKDRVHLHEHITRYFDDFLK